MQVQQQQQQQQQQHAHGTSNARKLQAPHLGPHQQQQAHGIHGTGTHDTFQMKQQQQQQNRFSGVPPQQQQGVRDGDASLPAPSMAASLGGGPAHMGPMFGSAPAQRIPQTQPRMPQAPYMHANGTQRHAGMHGFDASSSTVPSAVPTSRLHGMNGNATTTVPGSVPAPVVDVSSFSDAPKRGVASGGVGIPASSHQDALPAFMGNISLDDAQPTSGEPMLKQTPGLGAPLGLYQQSGQQQQQQHQQAQVAGASATTASSGFPGGFGQSSYSLWNQRTPLASGLGSSIWSNNTGGFGGTSSSTHGNGNQHGSS